MLSDTEVIDSNRVKGQNLVLKNHSITSVDSVYSSSRLLMRGDLWELHLAG